MQVVVRRMPIEESRKLKQSMQSWRRDAQVFAFPVIDLERISIRVARIEGKRKTSPVPKSG